MTQIQIITHVNSSVTASMSEKLKRVILCLGIFFLAACNTAPKVTESKLLSQGTHKALNLQYVYRNVEMKVVSSQVYGRGVGLVDTGFYEFGPKLVHQAASSFSKFGVGIAGSAVIIYGEAIPSGSLASSLLIVTPISGRVSANMHSGQSSYVFTAELFDRVSKRIVWTSKIDTSAWVGTDFVLKNIEKSVYDDAYAGKLNDAIATQMKKDGVI